MNNIHSYNDLLLEKQRLSLLLNERKILLKTEFEEIKTSLKPIKGAIETIGKFTSRDFSNPLLTTGIDIGVNLLLKNVILRNAGWIVKLLMPAMVKNYLSHEIVEDGNVMAKVGNFIKRTIRQFQQG
jgi:hypothetical protein